MYCFQLLVVAIENYMVMSLDVFLETTLKYGDNTQSWCFLFLFFSDHFEAW